MDLAAGAASCSGGDGTLLIQRRKRQGVRERGKRGGKEKEKGAQGEGGSRWGWLGPAQQGDLLHPRVQLRPQALEPTGACSAGRVRVLSIDGGRSPRPCWSGSSTAAGAVREPRGPRRGLLRHGGRVRRQRVLGGRAVRSTKE
ncbi:hypothetical protein VPH35_020336 [Triticum aestivum]